MFLFDREALLKQVQISISVMTISAVFSLTSGQQQWIKVLFHFLSLIFSLMQVYADPIIETYIYMTLTVWI